MNEFDRNENLWGYRKRLRFVCDSIESVFPDRPASEICILDIGCGSATQLGLPLARLGYQVTGVDTHEPSIKVAVEMSKDLPNAYFVLGSVDDLDTAPFPVVILSEVLEHVSEPEKLLRRSLEHLQQNGLAIVTVPNGYGEFEWDSWIYRNLGVERLVKRSKDRRGALPEKTHDSPGTENQDDGHVQFFTQLRIMEMFRSVGLDVIRKQGSTLMSGPFVAHTLGHSRTFIDWNSRMTDRLPLVCSSGWFFALQRRAEAVR